MNRIEPAQCVGIVSALAKEWDISWEQAAEALLTFFAEPTEG